MRVQSVKRVNHTITLMVALRYAACVCIALVVIVPIVFTVLTGFKSTPQLLSNPFGWPQPVLWQNYQSILATPLFWQQLLNSLFITVATALLVVVAGSMAAFVFARLPFPGRGAVLNLFMLGLLFPLAVAMLPLYITLRQLGLLNSAFGVILPQVAFALPVSILILQVFFAGVPTELEDAAYIDGCTPSGFFWRILLPLARPALATVAVLTVVTSWNNFLLPLLVLNNEQSWTLPLGVMQFQGQYGTDWALIMAFVSLAMVPIIAFYLLAERQLVMGLTAGAVKG